MQQHELQERDPLTDKINPQNLPSFLTEQKGLSPQVTQKTIHFSEDFTQIIIKRGILVNQRIIPNNECFTKKPMKKNLLNTKIHTLIEGKQDEAINLEYSYMDELSKNIFSVKENLIQLKQCKEVVIESSRVYIFALKRFVRVISQQLTKLTIENCVFFENDISAMNNKDISSNNKMLREMSLAFQIKALQLPNIESITIKLQQVSTDETQILKDSEKSIKVEIADQQKARKELIDKYNCDQNSAFLEFELEIKHNLEKKYQQYLEDQSSTIHYIMNGNKSNNANQIEDCINESIINDIQEHIHSYNTYIKGSLLQKDKLIVKGYCLEDPIAFDMIINTILSNQSLIKTVIFKETGTIPHESFLKFSDSLLNIKYLECIAFFDSQPSLRSYYLLKDVIVREGTSCKLLCKNKNSRVLSIALNRTSFNIQEYMHQVFGRQKAEDPYYQYPTDDFIPKHYGFFVLQGEEIYEFTPYRYCVKEMVFSGQEFQQENAYLEALSKYQIGKLIKKQDLFPFQVKQAIKQLECDEILMFSGIIEKIQIKYSSQNISFQTKQEQLNQKELEDDINHLFKHINVQTSSLLHDLIGQVKDPQLQTILYQQCQEKDIRQRISNQKDLDKLFIQQQNLLKENTIIDYFVGKQFISGDYPYRNQKSIQIEKEPLCSINYDKLSEADLNIFHDEMQKFEETIVNIEIHFALKQMNLIVLFKVQGGKTLQQQTILEFKSLENLNLNFFASEQFSNILDDIFQKYIKKGISLSLEVEDIQKQLQVWEIIKKLLEKNKIIHLEKLKIGKMVHFQFSFLNLIKSIKYLELSQMTINGDSFKDITSLQIEEILFNVCAFHTFDITAFKGLKRIKVKENAHNVLYVIENIHQALLKNPLNYKLVIETYGNIQLTNQFMTSIEKYRQNLIFYFDSIDSSTSQSLSYTMQSKFPNQMNYPLLNKFYGIEIDNKKKNDYDDDLEEEAKDQLEQNKNLTRTQIVCKELRDLYFLDDKNRHKDYYTARNQLSEKLPECCIKALQYWDLELMDKTITNQNLSQLLKNHPQSNYCLFRTSLFQQKYKPRNVNIEILENLITDKMMVYDLKEMDNIECLQLNKSSAYNCYQTRLIDVILLMSPHLQKLKMSEMNFIEIQNREHIHFSKINSQHLRSISLTGYYEDIEPILTAVRQSTVFSLTKLEIFPKGFDRSDTFDSIQIEIVEQHHQTLKKLAITVTENKHFEQINRCQNIQRLKLKCSSEQANLAIDLFSLSKLEEVHLQFSFVESASEVQLFSSQIQSILDKSQEESNHIKRICLGDFSKRGNNVYVCKKSKNQTFPLSIYYDNEIRIQKDTSDKNRISLQEYFTLQNEAYSFLSQDQISENPSQANYLLELHLKNFRSYTFLNTFLKSNQYQLQLLSFKNCNLQNNSLDSIDFSNLPRSIKRLDLNENKRLTSLHFLEPVYKKIQEYKPFILNIEGTGITYTEVYKYLPYLKQLEICLYYPLIEFISSSFPEDMQKILVQLLISSLKQKESYLEIDQQFRVLFNLKSINMLEQHNKSNVMILSPLQILSQIFSLQKNLFSVYEQQKEDDKFSLNLKLGNKYLLFLSFLLKQNQQVIFGYRSSYQPQIFNLYVQKELQSNDNKHNYTDTEHAFFDYLLLQKLKSQTNLQNIFLPMKLQISFELLKNKRIETNIDEQRMVEYLSMTPPSEITLENMSVSFIKTWYVINKISPLTFKTTIKNFDDTKVYNSSIGNYLTQHLHRNNFIRSMLCGTPQKYRYDETVQLLAEYLDQQILDKKHVKLLSLFPFYLFICIFGVVFFSLLFNVACGQGVSWYSYCCYIFYALVTVWIELIMFKKCLNYISHLMPSLEINLNPNFFTSYVNKIKQKIIDTPWINQWYIGYSLSFIQSQLARFDNFTNVAFLYSTYECSEYTIFYIALAFMAIPFLYFVTQFLKLIFKPKKFHKLPTSSLDTYYTICNIIEFRSVSDILDLVSPSNVISIRGRMFNARIISYLIRMVCESIPLVIIQIYNLSKQTMTSSLVLSLILSIISFLTQLIGVLTVTPSTLNQEDFNKMNEKKLKDQTIEKYEERLQTFEDEIFALNFYEHLKQIRFEYLKEKQKESITSDLDQQYKSNYIYFKHLFDQSKELMQKAFCSQIQDPYELMMQKLLEEQDDYDQQEDQHEFQFFNGYQNKRKDDENQDHQDVSNDGHEKEDYDDEDEDENNDDDNNEDDNYEDDNEDEDEQEDSNNGDDRVEEDKEEEN